MIKLEFLNSIICYIIKNLQTGKKFRDFSLLEVNEEEEEYQKSTKILREKNNNLNRTTTTHLL